MISIERNGETNEDVVSKVLFFFFELFFSRFILLRKANAIIKTNFLWQTPSKGTKMHAFIPELIKKRFKQSPLFQTMLKNDTQEEFSTNF